MESDMRASFLGPLLSALAHTLMLIGFGAALRAARVLDDAELGGLSKFCAWLSLPCALFASVADLRWSDVDWTLLLGMFVSKAIVFVGVSAIGLLHSRTPEAVARAGLFSILVTKSNDIAFALPIVAAIFPPAYVQMVYLFVPLQLALINPIGLAMMEWGCAGRTKGRRGAAAGSGKLLVVILSTLTSPVMLAVGAGLVANVTLHGRLPQPVAEFIATGAQAYTATALLIVGAGLNVCGGGGGGGGEQRPIDGVSALVGASLVFVKVFVASLVMYHVVGALTNYDADAVSFALVYGCMPPAPTVFVWARQYGVAELMVSRLLIVSLLVSTAFIVVTGLMIDMGASAARDDRGSMRRLIGEATVSANALALGGAAWLAAVVAGCAQMRTGLRAELLPLALCVASSAVASLARLRLAPDSAARLPVEGVEQLAHHAAVAYAACFALRLLRSLRAPPGLLAAERVRYHVACALVAAAVTAAQLADARAHAPVGLGSRAPRTRIALYTASLCLTVVPLLLFNARYLRAELRQHEQTEGASSSWAEWAAAKWAVQLVRASGERASFAPPVVLLHGEQPRAPPQPPLVAAASAEPAAGPYAAALARGAVVECGDQITLGAVLAEVRALVPGALDRSSSRRAQHLRAAPLLNEQEWDSALATAGITSAAAAAGGSVGAGIDVSVQPPPDDHADEGAGDHSDDDAADAWVELRITRRRAPRRARTMMHAASEAIARAAAETASADAPLVTPLSTPSAALLHGERERAAHALLLRELLGDSVRHLSWLAMALVGMTLGLSAALQDAADSGQTVLTGEIALLRDLAFSGQVIVMTAGFGLHPVVVAALRRLWRRARARHIEQRLRSRSRAELWQEVNEMRQVMMVSAVRGSSE